MQKISIDNFAVESGRRDEFVKEFGIPEDLMNLVWRSCMLLRAKMDRDSVKMVEVVKVKFFYDSRRDDDDRFLFKIVPVLSKYLALSQVEFELATPIYTRRSNANTVAKETAEIIQRGLRRAVSAFVERKQQAELAISGISPQKE